MDYLPLFHNLQGRDVLIIGGGSVALRKASLLVTAGAKLHVIADRIMPELIDLLARYNGSYLEQVYKSITLDKYVLVIVATSNPQLNKEIADQAIQNNIAVNVVDNPQLSNVIFPAIIDRSPMIIAVSTGGGSPVLARLLRTKLEALFPANYAKLALLVKKFRASVKRHFTHPEQRRIFWEKILQGPVAEQALTGQLQQAELQLQKLLNSSQNTPPQGEVYLIGAGPGDPDLLTFKALRLMQQADIILYDRLITPAILGLCRRDAERIYVGKNRNQYTMPQQEINQLLVSLAQKGKRVARLKGGDPFIFGRGSEEIASLAELHIPFQVIPGITAASGCAAYAGIPLTHRDYAQSVRFVTGHLQDNNIDLPWSELVTKGQTIVFYMGLTGLPIICKKLIAYGREPTTPIALIEQGTTESQKVYSGILASFADQIASLTIQAPTLIIVGEVVNLRTKLAWFNKN